jgi:hypothetical protein
LAAPDKARPEEIRREDKTIIEERRKRTRKRKRNGRRGKSLMPSGPVDDAMQIRKTLLMPRARRP